MMRRNFILALTVLAVAAVVSAQKELRQVGSRSFHFLVAWHQRRAMDAARKDLMAIVQAELGHIKKQGKFATLDELVSSRELDPEMAGRHGYVYSIRLEGNAISASAYPAPGEQLPALVISMSGPGLASVLARLQNQH